MIKFNFSRFKAALAIAFLIVVTSLIALAGFTAIKKYNQRVIWENQYKAVQLNIKTPDGRRINVGCADDSVKLTVRKDSILFDGPHTKAGYKTLLIDSTTSLFYGVRKDGTVVYIQRIKREYMPGGKEFELLYVDEKDAELLFNAYEPCPRRKKLNEVLPIGE